MKQEGMNLAMQMIRRQRRRRVIRGLVVLAVIAGILAYGIQRVRRNNNPVFAAAEGDVRQELNADGSVKWEQVYNGDTLVYEYEHNGEKGREVLYDVSVMDDGSIRAVLSWEIELDKERRPAFARHYENGSHTEDLEYSGGNVRKVYTYYTDCDTETLKEENWYYIYPDVSYRKNTYSREGEILSEENS